MGVASVHWMSNAIKHIIMAFIYPAIEFRVERKWTCQFILSLWQEPRAETCTDVFAFSMFKVLNIINYWYVSGVVKVQGSWYRGGGL